MPARARRSRWSVRLCSFKTAKFTLPRVSPSQGRGELHDRLKAADIVDLDSQPAANYASGHIAAYNRGPYFATPTTSS